jgi:undecaprenyl-diphosphatase
MTLLATDSSASSQPVELPAARQLLTALGCSLGAFVTIALLVHGQRTNEFDQAVHNVLVAPSGSWVAHVALVFTTLGDAVPLLTILVMAGVLAPVSWGGGWRLLSLPWASAVVAFLIASFFKNLIARERPPASDWASPAHGFAFPSGHATTATAGYLVLAILVSMLGPVAKHRVFVLSCGVALAALVGLSRVILGVHWPTDVLAGWALGVAVAAATLAISRAAPSAPRDSRRVQGHPQ